MRTRSALLLGFFLLALAATAGPASASRGQITILDASEDLSGSQGTPANRDSALADAASLGADTVRVLFYWRDVVGNPDATAKPAGDSGDPNWAGYAQPTPDSPGSGWGKYDEIVRGIVSRGMQAMIVPTGRFPNGEVPHWASNQASKDGTDPNPTEFGLFMRAVGQRYRGGYNPGGGLAGIPGVSIVAPWNEPNSPFQLSPQVKNGVPYAPSLYRALYVAGQQGLRAGGYQGQILLGGLAPRGTASTLGPIPFTEELLCLTTKKTKAKRRKGGGKGVARVRVTGAGCAPLQADAYGHHPHTGFDPPFRAPFTPGDVTVANLGELSRLLRGAARVGAINSVPLYIDEYGIQTNPPDTLFGRTLQEQAEFIGIAEFLGWRDASIGAWSQYLMRDDGNIGGFQSGLRFASGAAKPSFDAFRTPLAIRRVPGKCLKRFDGGKCATRGKSVRVRVWGEVRPAGSATVQLERSDGGGFVAAGAPFRTDAGGYFQRRFPYRNGRQFRLVWFDAQSGLPNACAGNCVGPGIRAFKFK